MASGTATVKQVISGDTLVLTGTPKGGPPPEKTIVLASIMAPRMAIKTQARESGDEPFAFEAREFLRQRLIGKVVEFVFEYDDREKNHSTVRFEGENMGLALVREGLAKVRNSRSPLCAKNIDELRDAESFAKEGKLGIWTDDASKAESTIREIQWITNDAPAAKAFVNFHKNQQLPAIIEYIRDGGCYRAYFPDQKINATIMLSGVQVDGFKKLEGYAQPQAEPFALEAKFFTEVRILNRDVKIRIEDADDYGSIFGSVLHPNGNIAVLLTRNGFGKIQDWSIKLVENPVELREAQKEAQQQRIRKWRNWLPQTIEGVKEYQARVLEVVSGDCVIVIPLEDEEEEKRLYLASIRCPRAGTRTRQEDPWAFESKEFLRKKLIGKKVTVILEYTRDPIGSATGNLPPPASDSSGKMHFVSILIDKSKTTINETLITEGLAKTSPHRNDDPRAENFEVLLQKEKEAADKKIGVHSPPSSAPKHRVNELLGAQNSQMAKGFEESLKRLNKIDGIVEHVFNGGRFKIRLPSESIAISFSLGGVKCPATARQLPGQPMKPAEELGQESLQFSRETLMQRGVSIKIDTCDRGGNFIGVLWLGKDCMNVQLVEKGLARMNEMGFAPSSIRSQLEEAEKNAREKRLGLWSLPSAFDSVVEAIDLTESVNLTVPSVSISQCNGVDDFYIQELPLSKIDKLQEKIASHVQSIGGAQVLSEVYTQSALPKVGEIVLSRFSEDQEWYRAKIESVDRQRLKFKVLYIDFGNSESVGLKEIYRCTPDLHPSKCPAFSRHCCLSGLKPAPELEAEGADAFDASTAGRSFRCLVESLDPLSKKSVVVLYPIKLEMNGSALTNAANSTTVSVNEDLVARGFAIVNKRVKSDLIDILKVAESKARKSHLNVWRHGDIDEDSDNEKDFPSLG